MDSGVSIEFPGHVSGATGMSDFDENVSKMLHVVAFAPDRSRVEISRFRAKDPFAF